MIPKVHSGDDVPVAVKHTGLRSSGNMGPEAEGYLNPKA